MDYKREVILWTPTSFMDLIISQPRFSGIFIAKYRQTFYNEPMHSCQSSKKNSVSQFRVVHFLICH